MKHLCLSVLVTVATASAAHADTWSTTSGGSGELPSGWQAVPAGEVLHARHPSGVDVLIAPTIECTGDAGSRPPYVDDSWTVNETKEKVLVATALCRPNPASPFPALTRVTVYSTQSRVSLATMPADQQAAVAAALPAFAAIGEQMLRTKFETDVRDATAHAQLTYVVAPFNVEAVPAGWVAADQHALIHPATGTRVGFQVAGVGVDGACGLHGATPVAPPASVAAQFPSAAVKTIGQMRGLVLCRTYQASDHTTGVLWPAEMRLMVTSMTRQLDFGNLSPDVAAALSVLSESIAAAAEHKFERSTSVAGHADAPFDWTPSVRERRRFVLRLWGGPSWSHVAGASRSGGGEFDAQLLPLVGARTWGPEATAKLADVGKDAIDANAKHTRLEVTAGLAVAWGHQLRFEVAAGVGADSVGTLDGGPLGYTRGLLGAWINDWARIDVGASYFARSGADELRFAAWVSAYRFAIGVEHTRFLGEKFDLTTLGFGLQLVRNRN